jgi:ribonuclease D
MDSRLITDSDRFEELCAEIRDAGEVAFDTEFVSEYSYRPELCLLQFAVNGESYAVDPLAIDDLSTWWDVMADDHTTVIVHGGQAEIRFCLTLSGLVPRKLVDIQLAEGLRSRSYPLSYSNLIRRVMNVRLKGKETRTDWRRRPLSDQQIFYALEDVKHVAEAWRRQSDSLKSLGRLDWATAEFDRMIDEIKSDLDAPAWHKLPGLHRLSQQELGVAVELAAWREQEADVRGCQPRRVLRDDLLADLCRRQPKTEKDLLATRDMSRSNFKRGASEMLKAIKRGLAIPPEDIPIIPTDSKKGERNPDEEVLGKLLALALANRCAELNVSMQLVGTSHELRQLVRLHVYKEPDDNPPKFLSGWRAEVCGDLLVDVLDGKISFRVADPSSDHPLVFERRE